MSKAVMGLAVGIAGIFVGYCFYFDQKRRSDPDFKKKLRERKSADLSYSVLIHVLFIRLDTYSSSRRVLLLSGFSAVAGRRAKKQAQQKVSTKILDLRDHEVVQKFFLQEVSLLLIKIIK